MTFLDSSVIIDVLQGVPGTVAYLEERTPYFTSSVCVFEVLQGKLGTGDTDVVAARQEFGGVRSLALNEDVAREAARMQDRLIADGQRMPARDLLVAATARSTGDELVVADSDFETRHLQDVLQVTNLAGR